MAKLEPEKLLREDVHKVNKVLRQRWQEKIGGKFNFPEKHILFEDILIKKIAALSPEYCLKVMRWCKFALKILNQIEHDADEELRIYDVDTLLCFISESFSGAIEYQCTHYGKGGLTLGYSRLWRLTAIRLYIYLTENPIASDVSTISSTRIAKELPNSPDLQLSLDQALQRLSKIAIHTYKKILKSLHTDQIGQEQLRSLVWETAKTKIASDDEGLIRAAKGDGELSYVPNDVVRDLINEFYKTKLERQSLDLPIKKGSELSFKDILEEDSPNPEEVIETLDNQKIITRTLSLIDNPAILTDRERQVISMRYLQKKDEVVPFEEIGEELGISRQTAKETEARALKKLFPHLKHFKP